MMIAEEEAAHEQLLQHMREALSILSPAQARRLHMRYMLEMKFRDIAEMEGISPAQANQSVRSTLKKLRNYFKKQKWLREEL